MDPLGGSVALHLSTSLGHLSSTCGIGKDGARVRMNVATYQKKENEIAGKRELGEEEKQSTDFRESTCCPSVVVQRAAQQKKWLV